MRAPAALLLLTAPTTAFGQSVLPTPPQPTPKELVAPSQTGPMAPTSPSVESAGPVQPNGLFRFLAPPAPARADVKAAKERRPQ